MKKNIYKNYLYNISYQITVILLSLATTPYIARVIGAEGIGEYTYTQSITYYFILFGCIGLNLYGQREIAYVQEDKIKISKTFWELISIRLISNIISIVLFIIFFVKGSEYHTLFLIQILDIVGAFFDISWFFQGLEDFKKIAYRNFFVKLLGVICIFLLIKTPSDLNLYVFCYSITILIGNISMWFNLPKIITRIKIKELSLIKHLKPTFLLFIPQVATSIYTVMDKTMIGTLTGIQSEVAFYEEAQKIVRVALTFITSVGLVMLPRVSNVYSKNDNNKVIEYLRKSFKFVFMISMPLAFGLASISNKLIPCFLGDGYEKVALNLIVISPIIIIMGITNVIGTQYLLPVKRQKEYLLSIIIGTCVNLVVNYILIPNMLSLGAAIGSVIAEIIIMICQIYFVKKEFDFKSIFSGLWKYILASIIMLFIIIILDELLPVKITSVFIQIIIGGIIYFLSLILMRDSELIKYIDKLKNRFKEQKDE